VWSHRAGTTYRFPGHGLRIRTHTACDHTLTLTAAPDPSSRGHSWSEHSECSDYRLPAAQLAHVAEPMRLLPFGPGGTGHCVAGVSGLFAPCGVPARSTTPPCRDLVERCQPRTAGPASLLLGCFRDHPTRPSVFVVCSMGAVAPNSTLVRMAPHRCLINSAGVELLLPASRVLSALHFKGSLQELDRPNARRHFCRSPRYNSWPVFPDCQGWLAPSIMSASCIERVCFQTTVANIDGGIYLSIDGGNKNHRLDSIVGGR
jgi:hypothetical protein